jgi:hypothetical protein
MADPEQVGSGSASRERPSPVAVRHPRRVQLHAGRQTPASTVDVSAPSIWANPYSPADVAIRFPGWPCEDYVGFALSEFRQLIRFDAGGHRCGEASIDRIPVDRNDGPRGERITTYPALRQIRSELGGRDLACTCGPDEACHGDLLLVLANPRTPRYRGLRPSTLIGGEVPRGGAEAHEAGFHVGDCPFGRRSADEASWRLGWLVAEIGRRTDTGELSAPDPG